MKKLSFTGLLLLAASLVISAVVQAGKKKSVLNNGKWMYFQGHKTCRPAIINSTCYSTAFVVSNDEGTTVA